MKVLYIIDQKVEEGKTSGIIHKIISKISLWVDDDIDVELLSLYNFKKYNSKLEVIDESFAFNLKYHGRYFTLFRLFYSTVLLLLFFKKQKYDLVYMRQRPYMPFTKMALKNIKIIVELNTDDEEEYRAISKVMYIYNKYTRDWFYSQVDGFVSVTNDLASKYQKFCSKILVLANGVDVDSYPVKNSKNVKPMLCFVGSPGFIWHGLDKVEIMAKDLPEFDFKIIGSNGVNTNNLTYKGYLSLDDVKKEVQTSDIGICTLSLHNKNMNEACPLKSRQYLAQGLPIIYAYNDTDLKGDEEFTLKLPNTNDNVKNNIQQIKEFVFKCHNNESYKQQARTHAIEKLDINVKESKRVNLMKKISSELRIIYLLDQNVEEGKTSGIIYKVRDQIQNWEKQGVKVQLLSLYSFKLYDTNLNLIDDSYCFNIKKHGPLITLFRLFYSTFKLIFHLSNFKFDLIYMRTRPYVPFTRFALKKYKIIMELNTNDIEEWKKLNKVMYFYNLLTRRWFYNLSIGFVTVGNEIKDLFKNFKRPIEVIGNSIKVSDYEFIKETGNERPRVCFVGSPGFPWHGINKIKYLATKLKDVDFIFIGESGEDYENVSFYGYCGLERVTELLNTCDVAIGTMSLHEKGMNSTSTIKTRQYLAQGLPIFYGYSETDFDDEQGFLLELPNTPDNITENVEKIRDFIFYCFKNDELRAECRDFAEKRLDVSVKEKKRLDFIKKLYFESQT